MLLLIAQAPLCHPFPLLLVIAQAPLCHPCPLLLLLPQVYILTSRAIEAGMGLEVDESPHNNLKTIRDGCLKWMIKWSSKVLSSRVVAEVLGRCELAF